jgi:hypothetical protein
MYEKLFTRKECALKKRAPDMELFSNDRKLNCLFCETYCPGLAYHSNFYLAGIGHLFLYLT